VKTNVELTIERSEYKNLTTFAEEIVKQFKGQKTPSEVLENEHSLIETSIRSFVNDLNKYNVDSGPSIAQLVPFGDSMPDYYRLDLKNHAFQLNNFALDHQGSVGGFIHHAMSYYREFLAYEPAWRAKTAVWRRITSLRRLVDATGVVGYGRVRAALSVSDVSEGGYIQRTQVRLIGLTDLERPSTITPRLHARARRPNP
jgi:hypothetical protein